MCSESHLDGIPAPCEMIRDEATYPLRSILRGVATGISVIAVPSSGRRDGDICVGRAAGAS
jgi:hypothetical protein